MLAVSLKKLSIKTLQTLRVILQGQFFFYKRKLVWYENKSFHADITAHHVFFCTHLAKYLVKSSTVLFILTSCYKNADSLIF
jgi:hypothetical protein